MFIVMWDPHLWPELKGLYMQNKNGVKVVAKYDKTQARNFTLVLQCRTYENAENMWKIVERCWKGDDSVWDSPPQAFQTRPRQPREVLPGAPSVWAQSGDQVWNMRFLWIFTLMRHRPNSKLYLVLNFPLQRGSHTLTTPLEMGLWWVEARRYYWQSQGATPNHLMYKKVQYKCSCPQGLLVLLRALAKPASSSGICRSPFHKSTCGSCSRVVTIEAWTPWPRSLS